MKVIFIQADQCMKGDIDIEGMRNEEGDAAAKKYDLYHSVVADLPPIIPFDDLLKKHNDDYDSAREEYWEQLGIKALGQNKETTWFRPEDFACSREKYIENARLNALATFAFVKDGKWHERGEMGFWAVVSNPKDKNQWLNEFNKMFDALPDNTMITIVDCHI